MLCCIVGCHFTGGLVLKHMKTDVPFSTSSCDCDVGVIMTFTAAAQRPGYVQNWRLGLLVVFPSCGALSHFPHILTCLVGDLVSY